MTSTKAKKDDRTAQQSAASEPPNIFATPSAARYLGVSAATLRFWRANGEGPRFFHAGDRLVRYRRLDLDKWIESRLSK